MQQKILIVDDDPDIRQALKLRLRANHFETVHAVDGYSAIAQAYKEQPDLIGCCTHRARSAEQRIARRPFRCSSVLPKTG